MDIEEISKIFRAVRKLNMRGSFVISFCDCWFSADEENKIILYEAADNLISKYNLKDDLQLAIERGYVEE